MLARILITWFSIAILCATACIVAIEKTGRYIFENIEIPRNGILVVDKFSKKGPPNGSPERPFISIMKALNFAKEHPSFTKILVYQGKYEEKLIFPGNISITGVGDNVEIFNPEETSGKTIEISSSCHLSNVTVTGGKFGIYIPPGTEGEVVLNKVTIQNSSQWGLFNENSPSLSLKIISSKISNNARQGMYLNESSFYLNNSLIEKNGEEGIDLHANMNSTIKNSTIASNGEGGIETELGNINLVVENCKIKKNGSSGVNIQSFESNSTVLLKNNDISENTNFGVRCALHAPFSSPYFSKMVAVEKTNLFLANGDLAIDKNCKK